MTHALAATVVGLPYYGLGNGTVSVGKDDPLLLVREPQNPHDRNAIAVYASDGSDKMSALAPKQIGHLRSDQAGLIAPLLDQAGLRSIMGLALQGPRTNQHNKQVLSIAIEHPCLMPVADAFKPAPAGKRPPARRRSPRSGTRAKTAAPKRPKRQKDNINVWI